MVVTCAIGRLKHAATVVVAPDGALQAQLSTFWVRRTLVSGLGIEFFSVGVKNPKCEKFCTSNR